MASAQASEQRDSACSFHSAKLTCSNTNFSDSSPVASITACTLAKNSRAGWGAFQMPHLQEVFATPPSPSPLGFPPPPGDAALGEASSTRTASQRPEVTSLSSPQARALFSLSPWVSLLFPLCGGHAASQALRLSPFSADLGRPLGSGHSPRPQLSAPVCGWRKKIKKRQKAGLLACANTSAMYPSLNELGTVAEEDDSAAPGGNAPRKPSGEKKHLRSSASCSRSEKNRNVHTRKLGMFSRACTKPVPATAGGQSHPAVRAHLGHCCLLPPKYLLAELRLINSKWRRADERSLYLSSVLSPLAL